MNTAALLLALVVVTTAQEYEVSEVQVKLMAVLKNSTSSPTKDQLASQNAQNCCPYPSTRKIRSGVFQPNPLQFKCSEPVTLGCRHYNIEHMVGIAVDGKKSLTDADIVEYDVSVVSVQFECNPTSKKWTRGNKPTEYTELACAYHDKEGWHYIDY